MSGAPKIADSIRDGAGDCTDLANALRLADHHHHELRHCRGLGWLAWDGTRWAPDEGRALLVAQEIPAHVLSDAAKVAKLAAGAAGNGERDALQKRAESLMKWARASASASRLTASLAMAEPHLAIDADDLDRSPWLLNVANGTLDLRTGELHDHDPADLITRISPTPYDAEARAPQFEALVSWAMGERPALAAYLQRAAGYSATGSAREQCLLCAFGGGANGKSTILGAIAAALGEDYAVHAMPELLTAADGERHSTELIHLRGARMVLVSETEDGRRLAVQRMKQLTGEARITARAMRQDPTTFTMQATLWLQSNHRPQVTEQTRAVWRRLRVIPFERTVEREDRHLPDRLAKERPGILRWIAEGARAWHRDGLGMPPEVAAAVEDYRNASDSLGSFLADCCHLDEDAAEPALQLYEAYTSYCASEGTPPLDARKFKQALIARDLHPQRRKTGVLYQGVTLTTEGAGS